MVHYSFDNWVKDPRCLWSRLRCVHFVPDRDIGVHRTTPNLGPFTTHIVGLFTMLTVDPRTTAIVGLLTTHIAGPWTTPIGVIPDLANVVQLFSSGGSHLIQVFSLTPLTTKPKSDNVYNISSCWPLMASSVETFACASYPFHRAPQSDFVFIGVLLLVRQQWFMFVNKVYIFKSRSYSNRTDTFWNVCLESVLKSKHSYWQPYRMMDKNNFPEEF